MDVLLKNPFEGLMENRQEIGSSDQERTAKSINRLIIRVSNQKIVACSQQQQEEDEDKKDQNLGFKNHHCSSSVSNNNGDDSSPCCCCSVCGKSFGSMRALFGHMRCHPERQWRGIIQPCKTGKSTVKKPSSSSLSTGSDDRSGGGSGLTSESNPDFNLLGFLPNWSVSRKRRTRQNNNNNDDHHDLYLLLSDDRVADAVSALLTLKDVVSFDNRTSKKVDDSDCSRRQVSERKRTRELQESDITKRDFGTKKLKHLHKEEGGGEVKCVSIHPWVSLNGSEVEMEVDDLHIDNIHSVASTNGSEVLGVHESSLKSSDQCSSFASNLIQVHEVPESNDTRSKNHTGKYQCKICGMVFSKGQALGGHQRKHWIGSVITRAVPINFMAPPQNIDVEHNATHSVASASVSAEAASVKEHKVLDFDLNEMPSEDADEFSAGHQS